VPLVIRFGTCGSLEKNHPQPKALFSFTTKKDRFAPSRAHYVTFDVDSDYNSK
jgi:hypothetical protein